MWKHNIPLVSVPTIVGCVGALIIIVAAIATPIARQQHMLPGLSGEEVLPQIQNIPVIVVSAKTAVQDKVSTTEGELQNEQPR